MATRFTIVTEDKQWQFHQVPKQINEHFACYTLTRGQTGYWNGNAELSLKIELIYIPWLVGAEVDLSTGLTLAEYRGTVKVLALQLKALLLQDCVLLLEEEIQAEFV